jgi:hypothetical protein
MTGQAPANNGNKKSKAEKKAPVEKQPNTRGTQEVQIVENYKKLLDKY